MSDKVTLKNGPADGVSAPRPAGAKPLAMPLDGDLNLLKGHAEPYAFAIYAPGDDPTVYVFAGAQRPKPSDSFHVPFADGPMQGIQPMNQALQLMDTTLECPLDSNGEPLKKGSKVASIARYRRKLFDGIWKMGLVEIIESVQEAERLSDTIAEREFTKELSKFTSQQLIHELMSRRGFIGVVVMYPKDVTPGWQPKPDEELAIAVPHHMNRKHATLMLKGRWWPWNESRFHLCRRLLVRPT